jgi:hypothetical protein
MRLAVSSLTVVVGLSASGISKRLQRLVHRSHVSAQITHSNPLRAQHPVHPPQSMPRSLAPYDIEMFINDNPQSNLSPLWQSLGVPTRSQRANWYWDKCGGCRAESFEFDLDNESGNEVLLRVAKRPGEAFRYLVFKLTNDREDRWRLLGYVDAWGKYQEPSHNVLLSDGKPWLLVRDQGASGSGVALYIDRLFQVTGRGLTEVVAYSSEGHQTGFSYEPTREFIGRVSSCEIHDGQAIITIDYQVSYLMTGWDQLHYTPLFQKQQRAVLVRAMKRKSSALDLNRSSLSQPELDAVYNIDSLTSEDFLKYNYDELARLANGSIPEKKNWLREFLKRCEKTIESRRLSQLLSRSRN